MGIRHSLLTSVLGILALTSGCTESLSPPVATTISLSVSSLSFDAVGDVKVVTATVLDQRGNAIAGAPITFAASGTAVTVTPAPAAAAGAASPQTATITSRANGASTITATSGAATATVSATVTQVPTSVVPVVQGQEGLAGLALAERFGVIVKDRLGAPVPNVTVVFTVTSGGGTVTGATAVTNSQGIAAVSSFVLGPNAGANTVTAAVAGLTPLSLTVTGVPTPGSAVVAEGNNQATSAGRPVLVRPAVVVRNGAGQPIPNVPVTFSVRSGGGTITGATTQTDANGIARVGSWTLGTLPAPNTLAASVMGAGFENIVLVFKAVGCSANAAQGYSISVCFTTDFTTAQRAVFESAAARWAAVITADVPDFTSSFTNPCGVGFNYNTPIDDVVIFAALEPIDGPRGVLGSAGPCIIRGGSSLPGIGSMRFDIADIEMLETQNSLQNTILHEMGHVLGIGTLWQTLNLLRLPSSTTDTLDTHFVGPRAIAAFDEIGGATYTGGLKVPVENRGGQGTRNGHWRETVLRTELMTGFLNGGVPNPLSLLTVASLGDIGYTVNPAAADPFTISVSLESMLARSGKASDLLLENDLYTGPVYAVDRDGRITRVR